MPAFRLLSSHQQHTHLSVHTQVHAELRLTHHYGSRSLDNCNLLDHSYLPWFEVFYKLLNNLADYLTKGQVSLRRSYASALFYEYHSHIT